MRIKELTFILSILFLLLCCDMLITPIEELNFTGNLHLTITKPDLFRTITPNLDINSYIISFEGDEEKEPITTTSSDLVIELPTGLWSITVSGLDINETMIATVTKQNIYISEGIDTNEEVIISPLNEGIGTIDIIISWPISVGIDEYEVQRNNIIMDETKINITNENGYYYLRYTDNVEYGSHKFTLYLSKNNTVIKMILEIIQVYGNLTTSTLLSFSEDDF